MSEVLVLEGSPRRGGNSQVLMDAVARGIVRAGGTLERVRVVDLKIAPCIGCGGCDHTGHCVVNDDMTGLYEKIVAARRLLLVSPVYFYAITAQLKAAIDRSQALWNRKQLQIKKGVWQEDSDRKGYLVAVAATKGPRVFEGSILTAKYFFDATGFTYAGELLVKGIDGRGEMAKAIDELARAEEFGAQCLR
ncbi:MAG TPA: flavodoxin family protein [Desulfurivibrionaceae bacterium]|nr:flavodoxin family protein [Desulfurivibrionaceae bacterium]